MAVAVTRTEQEYRLPLQFAFLECLFRSLIKQEVHTEESRVSIRDRSLPKIVISEGVEPELNVNVRLVPQ